MIRAFSFLQRHPESGILYFRRSIPKRHRHAFGGRYEFKRSLRTHDNKVARPLAMMLYTNLQSVFNGLEAGEDMSAHNFMGKITFAELDVNTGKAKGLEIDYDGDAEKELAALQQVKSLLVAGSSAVSSVASPCTTKKEHSATLVAVCEKYCAEKRLEGAWVTQTETLHKGSFYFLFMYFGDVPIDNITKAGARDFKETLIKLPPNMTKGKYAGKSIQQILQMKPTKTLHVKTVNDHLQRCISLFTWALKNDFCVSNPFDGLKLKLKRKAIDGRHSFSTDELEQLFNPVIFNLESMKEPWQFWVPLIAIYTGARQQEISQLRIADIISIDGVHGFRFTSYQDEKEANGRLKNASGEREIPIHSKLIERGFLQLVEGLRDIGEEKIFPELFNTKSIKAGGKVSRWFNRTYMNASGLLPKPENRKIAFHSFRHNFTDCLKKSFVPEALAAQLCGRIHERIDYGTYGSAYGLRQLSEVIEEHVRYDFEEAF